MEKSEGVVVVWIDEVEIRSSGTGRGGVVVSQCCRICHEAEFESCKSLEAPCACSGSLKFAHRDCIQRWCNEKGNTVCEICLQNYEPGYSMPIKEWKGIDRMTIRDSLEIPRRRPDPESLEASIPVDYDECASSAERSAFSCPSFALTLTVMLLLRHILATLMGGSESDDDYPFTPLAILILRASGIVLPMYIIFRASATIIKNIRLQYQRYRDQDSDDDGSDDEDADSEGDEDDMDSSSDEDDSEDEQHLV